MGFLGGLLSTVASGAMSLFGANQQNQANSAQRADQYQVASADMTKAGLNPAMMFGSGGPSAPVPMQNTMTGAAEAAGKGAQSAVSTEIASKTIDNLTQQIANMKADEAKTIADTAVSQSNLPLNSARTAEVKKNIWLKQLAGENTAADTQNKWRTGTVLEDAAKTARNNLNIDATARKIADQAGFFGRKASDVIDPISSAIGAVHGAGKAKAIWDMLNMN